MKTFDNAWQVGILTAATLLVACGGHASLGEDTLGAAGEGGQITIGGSEAGGTGGSAAGEAQGGGGGDSGAAPPVVCPCSRRPETNPTFRCPAGIGESVTATIGPAGGKLELSGRQGNASGVTLELEIAPRQLSGDVELTLTEVGTPPPADLIDYSPIYTLEGDELPAQVTAQLPFGNIDGAIPPSLTIYVAETPAGPFSPLPGIYINAGFLQGYINAPAAFLAAAPRPPELAECP